MKDKEYVPLAYIHRARPASVDDLLLYLSPLFSDPVRMPGTTQFVVPALLENPPSSWTLHIPDEGDPIVTGDPLLETAAIHATDMQRNQRGLGVPYVDHLAMDAGLAPTLLAEALLSWSDPARDPLDRGDLVGAFPTHSFWRLYYQLRRWHRLELEDANERKLATHHYALQDSLASWPALGLRSVEDARRRDSACTIPLDWLAADRHPVLPSGIDPRSLGCVLAHRIVYRWFTGRP